jgi:hypothetical protein
MKTLRHHVWLLLALAVPTTAGHGLSRSRRAALPDHSENAIDGARECAGHLRPRRRRHGAHVDWSTGPPMTDKVVVG